MTGSIRHVRARCGACSSRSVAVGQNAYFSDTGETPSEVPISSRDIVNLTQAGSIGIPMICFGGSNGLTPARFLSFAESIGTCTPPSCDGATPRVLDAVNPRAAFPAYGDVAGGFEVHMSEGFAHNGVLTAGQVSASQVVGPLSNFIARNAE